MIAKNVGLAVHESGERAAPSLPPAPWDKQPREGVREYAAFRSYLDQQEPRSITRCHDSQGLRIPPWMAHHFMYTWDWRARVVAYDAHVNRVMEEEREMQAKYGASQLAARHMSVLKMALDIAEAEFAKLHAQTMAHPDYPTLRPGVLLQLMERVVTLQRLVLGETTQKIEVTEEYDFSKLDLDEARTLRESLLKAKKET